MGWRDTSTSYVTIRNPSNGVVGSFKYSAASPVRLTSLDAVNDGSTALVTASRQGFTELYLAKAQPSGQSWQLKTNSGSAGRPTTDSSGNIFALFDATSAVAVVKLSSAGSKLSQLNAPLARATPIGGTSFQIDASGNIYIAYGVVASGAGYQTVVVAKYNSAGVVQWQRDIRVSGATSGAVITRVAGCFDPQSNFYVMFSDAQTGGGSSGLVKIDASGALVWQFNGVQQFAGYSYTTETTSAASDGAWLYLQSLQGLLLKLPTDGSFSSNWSVDDGKWDPITWSTTSAYSLGTLSLGNMTSSSSVTFASSTDITFGAVTPTTVASSDYDLSQVYHHDRSITNLPIGLYASIYGVETIDFNPLISTGAPRKMDEDIGTAQQSSPWTSKSWMSTLAIYPYLGTYVSPPLAANATISGAVSFALADAVTNTALNFTAGAPEAYVWRPSTKAVVGTLRTGNSTRIGSAPGAINTEKVSFGSAAPPAAVNALAGDLIVVEWFGRVNNAPAAAYTGTAYLDGTTVNTTNGATVSNFAAFMELTETLSLLREVPIAAAPTATATATAALAVVNKPVAAATTATATVSAALYVASPVLLASTPGAVSTLTTSLVGTTTLVAQPSATATLTAPLALGVGLASSAPASAALDAPLSLEVPLAAATSATSTASARLAMLLASAAAASATASGALITTKPLSTVAAAVATLVAEFPPPILMAAGAVGSASVSADLALAKPFGALLSAGSTLSADLLLQIQVAASGAGVATTAAALGLGKDLTAQPAALATAQAVALRGVNLATLATQNATVSAYALVSVFLSAAATAQSHRIAKLQTGIQPVFDVSTRYVYVPATLRQVRIEADARPEQAGAGMRTAVILGTTDSVTVLPDPISP